MSWTWNVYNFIDAVTSKLLKHLGKNVTTMDVELKASILKPKHGKVIYVSEIRISEF